MSIWHELNESETVLVFVHGLNSSSTECWTAKNEAFWPELIQKDARFKSPSIFMANFFTTPASNDYGIKDCAEEVFKQLLRVDTAGNRPPIEKNNIIFVTHSTGGVVARYLLEANSDHFKGKKIGLCLYASPSYGSKWSSRFGLVLRFFNHKLTQELKWGSDILEDLDARFFKLLETGKLSLEGMEAYENKALFRIPIINARVVEKASAARYFGRRTLIADSDHSSIVKPETTSCQSHEVLLDFALEKGFLPEPKALQLEEPKAITHQESRASMFDLPSLFDRYAREYEDFFIHREADSELEKFICNYSVWVCGASGTGKTASITRRLCHLNCSYQYVSLGASIGASVADLLKEIYFTLTENEEGDAGGFSGPDYIKKISEVIREKSSSPFYLFIEEIPINNEAMFLEFSNYIYAIISSVNQVANFRLVLSSIFHPNATPPPEMQKITERLKVVEWVEWGDEDMEKLADVLESDTGVNVIEESSISDFRGIPRNMKNHCRDKLSRT